MGDCESKIKQKAQQRFNLLYQLQDIFSQQFKSFTFATQDITQLTGNYSKELFEIKDTLDIDLLNVHKTCALMSKHILQGQFLQPRDKLINKRQLNDAFAHFLARNFYDGVYRTYEEYQDFPEGLNLDEFHTFFSKQIKPTLYTIHTTEDLKVVLESFENIFIKFLETNNIQYSEDFLNAYHMEFST